MRGRWVSALLVIGIVVGVAGAQVYPVRWEEDSAVTRAPAGFGGTISAEAIQLRVLDEPPFACDASNLGYLFMQKDLCAPTTSSNYELCFCGEAKNKGTPEIDWWLVKSVTRCSDLIPTCPA